MDQATIVIFEFIKANPWVSTNTKGDDAGSELLESGNGYPGVQSSALPSEIGYRTNPAYRRGTILEAYVGDTPPRTHRGDSR